MVGQRETRLLLATTATETGKEDDVRGRSKRRVDGSPEAVMFRRNAFAEVNLGVVSDLRKEKKLHGRLTPLGKNS